MLIDNCAAPPDHHRLDRSGDAAAAAAAEMLSPSCVTTLRVPCEIPCATTVASMILTITRHQRILSLKVLIYFDLTS